jgi:hypothetical protein
MSEWKIDEKLSSKKILFLNKLETLTPLPSGDWLLEIYNKYLD